MYSPVPLPRLRTSAIPKIGMPKTRKRETRMITAGPNVTTKRAAMSRRPIVPTTTLSDTVLFCYTLGC